MTSVSMDPMLAIKSVEEVVDPQWAHLPDRVSATYEGQTLFITGGTGLVGKVLLDKILRCGRGVKMIYVLVRPRKGKSGMERIDAIFESPLFDLLKSDKSNDFRAKVRPICGDIMVQDLGISPDDRKLLQEEVNIVYHSAACVRFDELFKRIVLTNVRGSKCMLELARGMRNLKLYVHVSTAYAHTKETTLEEKMYDPPADPHQVLKIVAELDDNILETFAPKYMAGYPNNYGFSKALSEGLVNEEIRKGQLPIIIARPSVVVPIIYYPLPGWTDNLNGPSGLLIAAGKGILRTIHMPNRTYADFIPADMVGNALCVATFVYCQYPERREELSVINLTTSSIVKLVWQEIIDLARRIGTTDVPFNWIAWYPGGSPTKYYYWHEFNFIIKQLLPALVGDAILKCIGIKPVLMKVQKRISKGYNIFQYYTNNQWNFVGDKVRNMRYNVLNDKEADIYVYENQNIDIDQYFKTCALGSRRYLLNEPDETLPTAKRHLKMMIVVDKLFMAFLYCLLFCFIYKLICNYFYD